MNTTFLTEATRRGRRRYGKITEAKLERWYGVDGLNNLLRAGAPLTVPVPIMGTPACMLHGEVISKPWWEIVGKRIIHDQRGTGFASLSDLISEATSGKSQDIPYSKTGPTGVVAVTSSLWKGTGLPPAGADGAAPAGGTVPTRTTTGALGQQNPGGSDTLHLTTWTGSATVIGTLMLVDLLLAVTTAANPGTGAITVTGTQSRYTGSAGTSSYAAGCLITNRVTVALAATAHNITYTYTDQDNNTGASSGAMTGVSGAIVERVDFATPTWAAALAAGDTGVRQLTAITFSASPATGQVEHSIVKPLALLPHPTINVGWVLDGINSAFNLVQIQTDACLSFLDFQKTATTATNYTGLLKLVSG